MPIEKQKVINRFKSLFKTVALSNKRLDEISAKLANNLPDDADDEAIDSALNFQNDLVDGGLFLTLQKSDDRAVNEANRIKAENNKKVDDPATEADKPTEPPKKAETPPQQGKEQQESPLEKMLREQQDQLKTLMEQFNNLQEEKKTQTIRQQADNLLKGVPAEFREMAYYGLPKDEAELPTFVEDVKTKWSAVESRQRDPGGVGKPPVAGEGVPAHSKEQTKNLADILMPATK